MMLAAKHASVELLTFLVWEVKSLTADMILTSRIAVLRCSVPIPLLQYLLSPFHYYYNAVPPPIPLLL